MSWRQRLLSSSCLTLADRGSLSMDGAHGTARSVFITLPHVLEDHGALACSLGPDDEVVPAGLLAAEDGIQERLLSPVDVLGLGRVH